MDTRPLRGHIINLLAVNDKSSVMIMDGLDTLTQVALADVSSFCFDTRALESAGRHASETFEDSLNTPVTTSSDNTFFGPDTLEPPPITATGRCLMLLNCIKFDFCSHRFASPYRGAIDVARWRVIFKPMYVIGEQHYTAGDLLGDPCKPFPSLCST